MSQRAIKTKGTASPATQAPKTSAAPYALEVRIAGLPDTPNARQHYMERARHVKVWRQKVFTAAWPHKPERPLERAKITFTRHSSVEPDFDNCVASFKACLDGLRQAGVIVDDRKKNVGAPEYLWTRSSPKDGFITIRVEEIA